MREMLLHLLLKERNFKIMDEEKEKLDDPMNTVRDSSYRKKNWRR